MYFLPSIRIKTLFCLRSVWFFACVFITLFYCHEVVSVQIHPEDYAQLWGGEGPVAGIWYYASETLYLLHLGLLILWFFAGTLLCLGRGLFNRPKVLVAHALLSGVLIMVTLAGI